MATRSFTSINKVKRSELDGILTTWESRYKLRLLSRNLPRAVIAGLLISIVIGIIGYWQQILLAQTLALITLVVCGVAGLLTVLYTQFFPRQRQFAAQYFDLEFHLMERMSTALEILDGRIHTHPEIESMQLADTLHYAREINPEQDIQMDFRRREWAGMGTLLIIILALILIPMILGQAMPEERPSAAVRAAQEDVRDITETIATDTDLDDIDREELLNALEIALERLQEEDISDEEAFAAMSQLQSQIEEIQNELQETLEMDQSALNAAAESMDDFTPPTDSESSNPNEAESTAPENAIPSADQLQQALEELSQNAQNMTDEQAQAAADALREAAQELMESNPELAEALRDAADALEGGDSEMTQQSLDNAQQQLDQQQQQMQQNSNAQQTLQSQSETAQQSANEISQQSQQSQQGQNQQSQQGQQSQSEQGQQGQSNSSDGQQQTGEQGNQPGDQSSENTQQGNTQTGQQPNANQPGQSEGEGQSESSDASGQGAGEGEASNTSMSGGGGEDQGADTDNQTTGEGRIDYEAIYNPTGIEGGGDTEIQLETDASDQTLSEGEFDDNPLGQSRVSYDTVFNDYQDAANRALESDYVPLGLRDVVRDYFTSLEPASGE